MSKRIDTRGMTLFYRVLSVQTSCEPTKGYCFFSEVIQFNSRFRKILSGFLGKKRLLSRGLLFNLVQKYSEVLQKSLNPFFVWPKPFRRIHDSRFVEWRIRIAPQLMVLLRLCESDRYGIGTIPSGEVAEVRFLLDRAELALLHSVFTMTPLYLGG